MWFNINSNINALNVCNYIEEINKKTKKTIEKLSSGFRINHAADDASGLAISEKMRIQITALNQGVYNSEDGISLLQTADGYLNDVCNMLNRLTELSVKSANGTYEDPKATTTDTAGNIFYTGERGDLQNEVNEILDEIDRISATAKFNQEYLFQGTDTCVENFSFDNLSLSTSPFSASSRPNQLNLRAVVTNTHSAADGYQYNIISSGGNTSNSSIRLKYLHNGANVTNEVSLGSLQSTNFSHSGNTWSRDFKYTNSDGIDITITQQLILNDSSGSEKTYDFSYQIQNNSTDTPVNVEFMFNMDTSYNNNHGEEYYFDGNKINNSSVYSDSAPALIQGSSSPYIYNSMPSSISIINSDDALPFSGKIQWAGSSNRPDLVSVGKYSSIDKWSYYSGLSSNLGTPASSSDMGISLYWNDTLAQNSSISYDFGYGIADAETDSNIQGIDLSISDDVVSRFHSNTHETRIQTGCESTNCITASIEETNTDTLKIKDIDVTSVDNANNSIDKIKNALNAVLTIRGQLGSQQNRLEHIIASSTTASENTSAANSRIRDTDMARESVEFTRLTILAQSAQAMLAQANAQTKDIISILNYE